MNRVDGGDELYVSNQIQPIADVDDEDDQPKTNGEASSETVENMLNIKN